jgi:CubicO group peptidase (beta-lactamase class C family)
MRPTGTSRRQLLLGAGALLLPAAPAAASEWIEARPEEVGLDRDLGGIVETTLAAARPNHELSAIVVVRHGRLAFERYFPDPISGFAQHPRATRGIASVTKSVTGLVYGIALGQGLVPEPDAPLMAQFPEYADLASEEKKPLRVEHALTMTLGLKWNEELPYGPATNDASTMARSPDPCRFLLARPVVAAAGAKWVYNGGATELLGRLIAKGAGQSLDEFARAKLFAPLGIEAGHWGVGPDAQPLAASGLRLSARDLARLGQLVLDEGEWNGRAVVPRTWVTQTFWPRIAIGRGVSYGYQWRLDDSVWPGARCRFASGNGGQRIFAFPAHRLVVATMGRAFNLQTQGIAPRAVVAAVRTALRDA